MKLKRMLALNYFVCCLCIFDASEELSEAFQLIPYPNEEFKQTVITCLVLDLVLCYVVENTLKTIYVRSF